MIVAKMDEFDEVNSLVKEAGIEEEKVCWILDVSSG